MGQNMNSLCAAIKQHAKTFSTEQDENVRCSSQLWNTLCLGLKLHRVCRHILLFITTLHGKTGLQRLQHWYWNQHIIFNTRRHPVSLNAAIPALQPPSFLFYSAHNRIRRLELQVKYIWRGTVPQQRLSGCPRQSLVLADVENLPVCFYEASFALCYRSAQEDPLWSVCVRVCNCVFN